MVGLTPVPPHPTRRWPCAAAVLSGAHARGRKCEGGPKERGYVRACVRACSCALHIRSLKTTVDKHVCVPHTRTLTRTRAHYHTGTRPPLVVGNNWLCSAELMGFLLKGEVTANVGAYHPLNPDNKIKWEVGKWARTWCACVFVCGRDTHIWRHTHTQGLPIGMLSPSVEEVMPIADELKSPDKPVWIVSMCV